MPSELLRRSLVAVFVLGVALAVVVAGWMVMTAETSDMPGGCRSDVVGTCDDQQYP